MTPITAACARQTALEARQEELLTIKEYAFVMRLSTKTVYRRVRLGLQPGAAKHSGEWRIDLAIATGEAPR